MAKRQQTFKRAARKRKAKQQARRAEDNRRAEAAGRSGEKDAPKPQPDQG